MAENPLARKGLGELQKSLERFESYNDGFILPETYLVLRLDAHRYGDWSQVARDEYPCGERLTRAFHDTATSLLASQIRVVTAYTHGDEISLFIDPAEGNSPIRRSRVISVLSSAASIHFGEAAGLSATFQARLSELPNPQRLLEYFLWQRRYCYRNAIVITLRQALLESGLSAQEAEQRIHGVTEEGRIAQLESLGLSVDSVPRATRRGALFWWETTRRDDSEQFRIASPAELPEDDGEFLDLISKVIRGKSYAADPVVHAKPIPAPMRGSKVDNNARRPHRKSNVSIFKI